jgi:hypothetical protein
MFNQRYSKGKTGGNSKETSIQSKLKDIAKSNIRFKHLDSSNNELTACFSKDSSEIRKNFAVHPVSNQNRQRRNSQYFSKSSKS